MLDSLPTLANPYPISVRWQCGFSTVAGVQYAEPQETQRGMNSPSFWFQDLQTGTRFEFTLGLGMVLGLVTPEMCQQVADYLTVHSNWVVATQTFEECFNDLLTQQRFHEPLWLEESGGVMPYAYTIDQIQQAFMLGSPPPSLRWLLNLADGSCWLAVENQKIWFQLTHLNVIFDSHTNTWSQIVMQTDPELGFAVAETWPQGE